MSSDVINKLKSIKEVLEDNYSTEQLFDVLDALLYAGTFYMLWCSSYLEHQLMLINSWYTTSQRRKISRLPKDKFAAAVVCLRVSTAASSDDKLSVVRNLGLERNLLIYHMDQWLKQVEKISQCQHRDQQQFMMDELRVDNPERLWLAARSVKYFLNEALQFREHISQKYMRLVVNEVAAHAKRQHDLTGSRQDPSDIAQNFMLAVYKAIDKCDPLKGTLTSYVLQWIGNAKTSVQFRDETGTAYLLPSAKRGEVVNFTVDTDAEVLNNVATDELSHESNLERKQRLEEVRKIARQADPKGYGRLLLGITELLSESEVRLLKMNSVSAKR